MSAPGEKFVQPVTIGLREDLLDDQFRASLLGEGALAAMVDASNAEWGPAKPMVSQDQLPSTDPKYFLLRKFAGENDLLVILNTKRCGRQCFFCTLPANSSREAISGDDILLQFAKVVRYHAPALNVVEKVTLSNDGSVLDDTTLPASTLNEIVYGISKMKRTRKIDLETRLEFVDADRLQELGQLAGRAAIGILTGFETFDERIRDRLLAKREPLERFLAGLDELAVHGNALTAYVLFKPDPEMTDEQAIIEAEVSLQFLQTQTSERGLPLMVRLNPMYRASGSRWDRVAASTPEYQPPRLTDVMRVAQDARAMGIGIYVGLSVEDRADLSGTYRAREDFSSGLVRQVAEFNDRKRDAFDF